MKRIILFLFAICLMLPAVAQNNKALEKALKKEYKVKMKEFKKEGWKIFGSTRSLDVALLQHYQKLAKDGEYNYEIVGNCSRFKSKNLGHQACINNACNIYAQKAKRKVQGDIVSDIAGNGDDASGEFDHFYAAYESKVQKEINGELEETFSVIKDNKDGTLRNYYWAFTLLKTVQHPADVKYTDEETGDALLPLTWLPERMHKLFSGINVKVVGNDGTNVDLDFTYNGKPVSSLDFSYFDGRDWSNLCSVKDGRGTMEFSKDMVPETVQLNYEYAYRGQAHISPEVQSVLTVVNSHTMRGARVSVRTGKQKGTSTASVSTMAGTAQSKQVQTYAPVADEARYRNVLNRVVDAIRSRQYDSVADCFTPDGAEMFKSLVQYGRARVLNTDACALYQYDDNVVARSIQMVFSFKQGVRKNFVEDVVFTFNADGKIDCLAFGLDSKARTDILGKGVWPIEARQKLMEFLENYKTAYALKRLDYLRTIFDDDAVIIVGHVATKLQREGRDAVQYKAHRYITRTHYSKEQYLRNLAQCFQSNEFVNIRFANNDVRKARTGEEYGIQIKQDYYSSSYGDVGYLYLQVDLNDRRKPVIKVRTWQPEPDPEVGLYGIGNW